MPIFRKISYELFFFSHILMAGVYIVTCLLHANKIRFLLICGVGLGMYVIDLGIRIYVILLKSAKCVDLIQTDHADPDTICVVIEKKNWIFKPGQWCKVCFPFISPFEWHPISICSCLSKYEEQEQCRFILPIKNLGGWS